MSKARIGAHIYVCGLDEMPEQVERLRPARLISLLPAENQPPTPPSVRSADHLRVLVDDIDRPALGFSAPERAHVALLLRFLRDSPPSEALLIHCLAGVSRSPAAALIALALDAPGREREAAETLRRAGPFVAPNRLLVGLADAALRRNGALVAALESMGPPDMSDFRLFALPRSLA